MTFGINPMREVMTPVYETDVMIPDINITDGNCHCDNLARYDFDLAECLECGNTYVVGVGYVRER